MDASYLITRNGMPSPNPDRPLSDQRPGSCFLPLANRGGGIARHGGAMTGELQTRTLAPQTPNPTVVRVAERKPRRMGVVLPRIGAVTSLRMR
jgi:hypothetical protein